MTRSLSLRPNRHESRRGQRLIAVGATLAIVVGFALSGSSAGAQSVESLKAKADKLQSQLDELDNRASVLNEQYLQVGEDLAKLEAQQAENQAAVDEAKATVEQNRSQAADYLVQSYVGAGTGDDAALATGDPNESVNKKVLLNVLRGDRTLVADNVAGAKKELDRRTDELRKSNEALSAQKAEQKSLVDELNSSVAKHQSLLSSANAEVRQAVEAERQRKEAAAAAAAAAAAEAAAAAQSQSAAQAAPAARSAGSSATTAPSRSSGTTAPSSSGGSTSSPAPTPSAPLPVSPPNGSGSSAVAAAMTQIGNPYRWGGTSPSTGFDCSGLTSWAWRQAGKSIPRTSGSQMAGTQRISESQLQPGDLVFFGSPVHHVGMYVGGGQMIHSPRTGSSVHITSIHRGFGSIAGFGRVA